MFVGATDSGKTYAARELLAAQSRLPVKIVNDDRNPRREELPEGHERVTWAEAAKARNCNVVVEDLIACKKHELAALQEILNWNQHHFWLPHVILITHACTGNGIFPLLENLTHLCFMTERTAAKSLLVALSSYNYPKDERRDMTDRFLADCGAVAHNYWVLDTKTKQFGRKPGALGITPPSPGVAAAEETLAAHRRTAERYLEHFSEDSKKSLALFDFIMAKTPARSLSPGDLVFTLRLSKSGRVVAVSMLDYLHTLTTQTPPTSDVLALHSYVGRYVALPRCLVANRHRSLSGGS